MNSETGKVLRRCRGIEGGNERTLSVGIEGDPGFRCYEAGKVYLLDADSQKGLKDRLSCFESVEAPPPIVEHFSELSQVIAACDALLAWMNGPVARDLLDWDVPPDYKVQPLEGPPIVVANRPASCSELVIPRLERLLDAAACYADHLHISSEGEEQVGSLDDAAKLLRRLRGRAERTRKGS